MYYSGSTPGLFSEADDNAWTFHSRELFDQGFFFLNDVGYRVLLRGQHLDFSVGQTITPGLFTPVNYSTKSPAYIYFFLYDCWVSCTTPGSTPGLFSGADDNTWIFSLLWIIQSRLPCNHKTSVPTPHADVTVSACGNSPSHSETSIEKHVRRNLGGSQALTQS